MKKFAWSVLAVTLVILGACSALPENSTQEYNSEVISEPSASGEGLSLTTSFIDKVDWSKVGYYIPSSWLKAPVRLVDAVPYIYYTSGTTFQIHVRNLGKASTRIVGIWYNDGSTWKFKAATLLMDNGVFSTYQASLSKTSVEFVVKYVNDFGTFWDKLSDTQNYKVQAYSSSTGWSRGAVGGKVGLISAENKNYNYSYYGASLTTYHITAKIAVENLGPTKKVGLHISFDGGVNWYDYDGTYSYTSSMGADLVEYWNVNIDSERTYTGKDIKFAVYYKDLNHNAQYWDNNFTSDYTLKFTSGSFIK